MSKLLDTALHMTPQTQCPGTIAYMSPEALRTPPVYNRKLDCFSFGVLSIQIMTRQFPDPGPARQVVEDQRYVIGAIEVPVHERERRRQHIDLIVPNHPLLSMALRCLEYCERNRPPAQELCDQLATLKEDPQYTQSAQQAQDKGKGGAGATPDIASKEQIADLQRSQLVDSDKTIEHLWSQFREKDEALANKQEQIQNLQWEIQQSRLQVEENSRVIQEGERQLRELHYQLRTAEQVTAEFEHKLLQKETRIRELEESIAPKEELTAQNSKRIDIAALSWNEFQIPPPKSLSRWAGVVTVDGSVVYIRYNHTMYAYNSSKGLLDSWEHLPDCPQSDSSLAVVSGLLTAVGGRMLGQYTSTLVSLACEANQKKWLEHFPPMLTSRSKPAVVWSEQWLVAAGGVVYGERVRIVEVMNTDMHQWFVASSLPHPFSEATATICGDNLYLLCGEDQPNGRIKSVLACSLPALLQSCQPHSLEGLRQTLTLEGPTGWHRYVADLPVYWSTCATLCGQLLVVGGYDDSSRPSDAVYKYNPKNNTWSIISHMPSALRWPLVAPLPQNKLMVFHGREAYTASIVQP